jgi:hypothetical protein
LTLPEDTVELLRQIHADPAWAIVALTEKTAKHRPAESRPRPLIELAELSPRLSLIVVDPACFRRLPGIAVIRMSPTAAFLAFDGAGGLADLEVAIRDRLEEPDLVARERENLEQMLQAVRSWRRSRDLKVATRSIVVVESRRKTRRRLSSTD